MATNRQFNNTNNESSLVVSGDSYLISYGNLAVIVVKSWHQKEFRLFKFDLMKEYGKAVSGNILIILSMSMIVLFISCVF